MNNPEVVYAEPNVDNPNLYTVESMCPQCEHNGTTQLLLTKLNQHKETIVSSFACNHCDYTNNDVQSGAEITKNGVRLTVSVKQRCDLNRQVIKTKISTLRIPEVDLEVPSDTQEGLTTTIEGIVTRVIDQLSSEQPLRKHLHPQVFEEIETFLQKLSALLIVDDVSEDLKTPFTVVIEDYSGLSNVEPARGLTALKDDPRVKVEEMERSLAQLEQMGFHKEQSNIPTDLRPSDVTTDQLQAGEFMDADCASCGYDGAKQRFCEIDIPGFRRCLIMAFVCDRCGFKDSEMRPSGELGDFGRIWRLSVVDRTDLDRDILKSHFAKVILRDARCLPEDQRAPDVDLEMGTLGSMFSTVEGLCTKAADTMDGAMPFYGDSTEEGSKRANVWARTIDGLKNYGSGLTDSKGQLLFPFTLELEDLADHSFIGERSTRFTGEVGRTEYRLGNDDGQLSTHQFERSAEQDDEIGITALMKEKEERDESKEISRKVDN
eukprot:GHVH01005330.1.p2 GENE.GHVH01005330.1~~GHVH01005330.1.p2  ORF type:complete len:490 (+),score=79.64 GHVH01005330.1:2328-3797(+)